jgi:SAM-dependent methyltransferase
MRIGKPSTPPSLKLTHSFSVCAPIFVRQWFYRYLVQSPVSPVRWLARKYTLRRIRMLQQRERESPNWDVERSLAARYAVGRGIDVGCGSHKTVPSAIGVDLTPKGKYGQAGNQLFEQSAADVVASGDALPFRDASLDYVIARHNLEHYVDPLKTLQEWQRVLRPGGKLVVIVPDEDAVNTIALDPTHYHVFTRSSLRRMMRVMGGWSSVRIKDAIPRWSIILVAERA